MEVGHMGLDGRVVASSRRGPGREEWREFKEEKVVIDFLHFKAHKAHKLVSGARYRSRWSRRRRRLIVASSLRGPGREKWRKLSFNKVQFAIEFLHFEAHL